MYSRDNVMREYHNMQAVESDDGLANETYLKIQGLRQRYSCSGMWVERRLADDAQFPRPVYFGRIRHWRLSELLQWERLVSLRPFPEPRARGPRHKSIESASPEAGITASHRECV